MKYTYFSVAEIIEVEVDEQLYIQLIAMDREELNSNRRYRRHCTGPLDGCEFRGEWFEDKFDAIAEIEAVIDMEMLLAPLTELQRFCFLETRMKGRTQREVAAELGKSRSTVQVAVNGAMATLKNIVR